MNFIQKTLRLSICILFSLMVSSGYGQSKNHANSIHENIQQRTDIIYDSLIKIRKDLHQHPEIAGHEERTSQFIKEYLLNLGLDVKANVGGYGVVGILNGNKKGKKVAWRADIDALASDSPDVVDFPSKNKGVRHICGHDVNTTIALGIANVLASQKDEINGVVYLIFQPSEENYQGAKAMIDDGLFDTIKPDEIYATHIAPMPTTMISTKPEWMFADYKIISVSFQNSDDNEEMVDYTKKLISGFQNIEPDSKFWDPNSLLDPSIGLGNPNTIFKDYLTVNQNFNIEKKDNEITVSTYIGSSEMGKLDSILPVIRQKIHESEYSKKLIDVKYSLERPNILNDRNLTLSTMNSISGIYGRENTILLYGEMPDGRGDDFAYFQEQIPGVYFYLGGSNFDQGIISMPHSPNFAVDESCIRTGVNYFSSMILERINNRK